MKVARKPAVMACSPSFRTHLYHISICSPRISARNKRDCFAYAQTFMRSPKPRRHPYFLLSFFQSPVFQATIVIVCTTTYLIFRSYSIRITIVRTSNIDLIICKGITFTSPNPTLVPFVLLPYFLRKSDKVLGYIREQKL